MRIVGGALGGRRFAGPRGDATRPTSERVREAVGSALEARGAIEGAHVIDLFAGTGALSFEALSRGAATATLVDADPKRARAIEVAARSLGLADRVVALALDLGLPPARVADQLRAARGAGVAAAATLVFADPPYTDIALVPPLLAALVDRGVAAQGAVAVIEHGKRTPPPDHPWVAPLSRYRYGDTCVILAALGLDAQ